MDSGSIECLDTPTYLLVLASADQLWVSLRSVTSCTPQAIVKSRLRHSHALCLVCHVPICLHEAVFLRPNARLLSWQGWATEGTLE